MDTILKSQSSDGVLRLILNRPKARNAFNHDMLQKIRTSFEEAAADPGIRVVVLSGAGTHFCAGGDIEWMKSVLTASPEQKRVYASDISRMYQAVYALPQPLVAQVQGGAMGGGLGLVCCADIVVSDSTTRYALRETRLGIVPAAISPYLVAAIGTRKAGQLALSGSAIGAETARDLGLVTHISSAGQAAQALEDELRELLQGANGAQRQSKALLRAISGQAPTEARCAAAVDALVHAWSQAEATEGFEAFLSKSIPPWRPAERGNT